ncbi:HAD family hydrolase [Catelliglobosispora koreensis]|uniref:HAD family hydrolase n=1 Tax=Catelliglobosispora koreensis TaxID=129052 RepID=UPI00037EE406|nr:HAD hydrolase-like protein [Catelliglobosispora koreensis]
MILVLWDVDGTLINNGGVSKEMYAAAFEILSGQPARVKARTDGRTDPEIMRDLIEQHGLEQTSEHVAQLHSALAAAMRAKADVLRKRGYAQPGGREAIDALMQRSDIVQSVLSGNIRDNAYIKLSTFDLHEGLDWEVGAFGSDANHRPSLVKIAQERASASYGAEFGPVNTVLIGDTLRDVRAGVEGGARVIAVTTGVDSAEDLTREGAQIVFRDLTNTVALLDAVLQVS